MGKGKQIELEKETMTQTHIVQTVTYPHRQVGPEVDYKDGDGLAPVIDGVDEVQAFFFFSVQHAEQG